MLNNKKTLFWLILSSFLLIPLIVSVISSIHVINFFELSNFTGLAVALSISFEIGALSALAGLVVMDKINKNVIYFIFILLTAYQMMGNTYYAYDMLSQKMLINPNLIKNWTELFGFETDDTILMKRIISIISGAILPIVSLCFLDLSVDYIKKSYPTETILNEEVKKKLLTIEDQTIEHIVNTPIKENVEPVVTIEQPIVQNTIENERPIVEDNKILVEEPFIDEEDLEIESLFSPNTQQAEVITEEDKKIIRDQINEIKNNVKDTESTDNTIKMRPKGGFHNVIYTK
jgi:hypothetical protein